MFFTFRHHCPRFVETPLPYIGVLLTLSIDIIFDSPTLQIADVFYGRPLSQKNEIAKKGKNVVMTSKTHYFVSLLLLLPYLEELKKSSSTGGKSGTFKSFALSCTVLAYLVSFDGGESCSFYSLELKNFNEANCTLWNNDNGNNWPRALKQFIAFSRLVLSYRVHSSRIYTVHISNT